MKMTFNHDEESCEIEVEKEFVEKEHPFTGKTVPVETWTITDVEE